MTRFFTNRIAVIVALLAISWPVASQDKISDSLAKRGWNFGILPAVSFDTDLGFQYGGLVDAFNYGDGTKYPGYNHEIYTEISRMTKGTGFNKFYYNSGQLFDKVRLSFETMYITDMAYPFHGFNGDQSVYNSSFTDDDSPGYRSRLFYACSRKMLRVEPVVVGKLVGKLKWVGGLGIYNYDVGSVNIDKLNKGKDDNDKLPAVPGLYDIYVDKGLIERSDALGGWYNHLFTGLVYDSRVNPVNPTSGMMQEVLIALAPRGLGNNTSSIKLGLSHRQFLPIIPSTITFAYRIAWTYNSDDMPWYARQLLLKSRSLSTYSEGAGGSKTVRGIKMNRVVGQDFAYGNLELRCRFGKSRIAKQNLYFVLSSFYDFGYVTRFVPLDLGRFYYEERPLYFNDVNTDKLHQGAGIGFRTVMNENFIVAFEYGRALSKSDGESGFYITLNFLF